MTEQQRTCPGQHSTSDPAPGMRDDEYLCQRCVSRACGQLRHLPELLEELDVNLTRQSVGGNVVGGHRDKGEAQPLPFNAKAAEVRAAALDQLREWAEYVAEWDGRPLAKLTPAEARSRRDLIRSTTTLIEHRRWIRSNEQGPALAQTIGFHVRAVRGQIDRREVRWFAGTCGLPTTTVDVFEYSDVATRTVGMLPVMRETVCECDLYARPGAAVIVCDGYREPKGVGGCNGVHPALTRHKYVLKTLRSKVLPLPAILSALPQLVGRNPEPDTVKRWRHRGKLRPIVCLMKHHTPAEHAACRACRHELFLGGDVIDLVVDDQPRPGRRRRDRLADRAS